MRIMKRKLLYVLALLAMACSFPRCEPLGTCKICRQVTYVDNAVTQEGTESQYCDVKLTAIENTPDIVSGNTRVTWECR
jgi:hypothetical protein